MNDITKQTNKDAKAGFDFSMRTANSMEEALKLQKEIVEQIREKYEKERASLQKQLNRAKQTIREQEAKIRFYERTYGNK